MVKGRERGRNLGLLSLAGSLSRRPAVSLFLLLVALSWLVAFGLKRSAEQRLAGHIEPAADWLVEMTDKSFRSAHHDIEAVRDLLGAPEDQALDDGSAAVRELLRIAAHSMTGQPSFYRLDALAAVTWTTATDPAQARIFKNPRVLPALSFARRSGRPGTTPPIRLDDGSWAFLSFFPVHGLDRPVDGTPFDVLAAVFSYAEMFEAHLESVAEALQMRVDYDETEIFRSAGEASPGLTLTRSFQLESHRFRLHLSPAAETRPKLQDFWLPLAFGHGLALLVAWGVHLLQTRRSEIEAQSHLMDGVFSNLPVTAFSISPLGEVERAFGKAAPGLGLSGGGGETLEGYPALVQPLQRALAGESVHLEADLAGADGESKTFELFLMHDDMRGAGALGFAIDISTRKWIEKALQSSEERYRRFFLDAPFGYFAVDREGSIELVNELASELTGYSSRELIGLPCSDIFVEPQAALPLAQFSTPREVRNHEAEILRADGSSFWGSLSVQPLHEDSGFVGSGLILLDISQRMLLQEQVRQSQKMEAVGRLAGGIAHDFNNLLTAIMGYAHIALDHAGHPKVVRNLEEIQKACRRATSLVSQLLAFSRRQIVEPKVFDLNELLRDMDPMLRRLTREEVDLASHLSRDLGHVRMDPGQMEQVIVNLVVNAQEAISGSGWITIETDNHHMQGLKERFSGSEEGAEERPDKGSDGDVSTGQEMVRLRISDTGCGMTSDVQEHIFEPFFTTKEDLSGTGLGLATVYGIVVEQNGGQILVDSALQQGTTLSILLPRVYEEVDQDDTPAPQIEAVTTDAYILLVEDEDMVRELAAEMLSSLGYRVLQARNGLDALDVVAGQEQEIDLLLTDVVMPKMGGEKLYMELRLRNPTLRVLYSSGYTESAVIHSGVKEGEVPFVHKPYTFDDLALAVQASLKS